MVDAQQVVEDIGITAVVLLHLTQLAGLLVHEGLDAPGDVDEGALRGLPHGLLVVDDVEDRAEQRALRIREFAVALVTVDDDVHDLLGRVTPAELVDRERHQFLAEAHALAVVLGDAPFQERDMLPVAGVQSARRLSPSADLQRAPADEDGGDRAVRRDRHTGGVGDEDHDDSCRCRHQYRGEQKRANSG